MAYSMNWDGTNPGCLIILIDQSASMEDAFGGAQTGAGKRKADMVATIVNAVLKEFVDARTKGATVKPGIDVSVLGYSGSDVTPAIPSMSSSSDIVSLSDLAALPLRTETRMRRDVDEVGNIIELPVEFAVWVDALANGATPMCAALGQARGVAESWAVSHPNSYPPVVINITDGEATDGDITGPATDLCRVATNDGNTLLFTCHITDKSLPPVVFPNSEAELPNDPLAHKLFDVSSLIPDSGLVLAQSAGLNVSPGSRGFIYNGDAASIRWVFEIGTKPLVAAAR